MPPTAILQRGNYKCSYKRHRIVTQTTGNYIFNWFRVLCIGDKILIKSRMENNNGKRCSKWYRSNFLEKGIKTSVFYVTTGEFLEKVNDFDNF